MVTGGLYLMSPATHTIGPWTLATPFVWLGHDLQHPFPVWKALGKRLPPGVLLSASQIMERAWFRQDAYARGVHAALEHQGPVFLDSGGYRVQRTGRASMSTLELLAIQDRLRPDIGSVLDVPLNPVGGPGTNTRRWRQTLANTTSMVKHARGPILAPVLHAYSPTLARRRCNEIRSILPNPLIICVGSLVPLLRGSGIADRFAARRNESRFHSRWRAITRLILTIRSQFPRAFLHVFGAGSLSTMYLLAFMGADSFDSSAWRLKAAYGAIQLSGTADRFPGDLRRPPSVASHSLASAWTR